MPIVGFNFTKISGEKLKPLKGNLSIKNDVLIKKLEEKDVGPVDQKSILVEFEFTCKYHVEDDNKAIMNLNGNLMILEPQEKIEKIMKEWKENKKLDKELMNHIITKSNIQALILSKDLNLPAPFRMPKVQAQ